MTDQLPNMTSLLDAFEMLADPVTVTIGGTDHDPVTRALLRVAATSGGRIHLLLRDPNATPSAMICRDSVCSAPIGDPERLREALMAR